MRISLSGIIIAAFALTGSIRAEPLRQARVTQVINDVKILPGQAAAKPAVVNDEVREGTAVRTGTESRTELTFGDFSIARLGANTIFSFDQGSRSVELGGGAILLRVPKDSGGGKIKTAAVTAAITGTTVMAEFNCEDQSLNRIQTRCPDANFKFIVLEGSMRVCKTANPRDCVDLGPGQMLAGSIDRPLGDPIEIDLSRLLATSLLIQGFPPLGSEDDVARAAAAQGGISDIGYLGEGTALSNVDVRDQRTAALPVTTATASPSPTPTATPSPTPQPTPPKFGTPPIITSSVPYTITSNTVIVTDPTITTNGITDEGRIYRDQANDGTPSNYFFTGTSAFDTASAFDQQFAAGGPIATFKFAALQLAGNPTISTNNNGPVRLALISVGDMASGAPGGALMFAGLQQLLLATQNGSLTLGSNISFQNIPALYFYARGAASILTVDSPISGTRDLFLQSEGALRSTGRLFVGQTTTGQTTGLGISLRAGGIISIAGDLNLQTAAGDVQNGANISVISGGDMTIGGSAIIVLNGARDIIAAIGGNIEVRTDGSLTAGGLNFSSARRRASEIIDGANIRLEVAGNLTTTASGQFSGVVFSHGVAFADPPLTLVNGGNLTLMVDGNLSTASGTNFLMQLTNDNGSTVRNGANILASIGGNLTTGAVTLRTNSNAGGSIETGGNLTLNVGGNVNVSDLSATVTNTLNGRIGTGGNITIDMGGVGFSPASHNASSILAQVNNTSGGRIVDGGNITFSAFSLTTSGNANFLVLNSGGTIESDVAISVGVANMNIGGDLNAYIDNRGGSIGPGGAGSGSVSMRTGFGAGAYHITVGGRLNVFGEVHAFHDVRAGTLAGTNVESFSGLIIAGAGGIRQFRYPSGVTPNLLHTLEAARISSQGGIVFDGDHGTTGADGGRLSIFAQFITFGISGADIVGPLSFNGGDSSSGAGGSGGTFSVATNNLIGNRDLSMNAPITATTGRNAADGMFGGVGGSVSLEAYSGTVTVGSTIVVSSNEPVGAGMGLVRRSASGGNITVRSGRVGTLGGDPRTVAINVTNSSQLLALLDAAAPGPGGKITILATGANTDVNVNGHIAASRGTIDIRHEADGGRVNIGNASNPTAPTMMSADVIKARAFGANGQLNIGNTIMSGDSLIRLYAQGSNGQLNFVANTTLSGSNRIDLAANTISIQPNVIVTITGDAGAAHVYTNNPNYSGFGGTTPGNGTFGGNGAHPPQPLVNAPPFDDPPPMPGGH